MVKLNHTNEQIEHYRKTTFHLSSLLVPGFKESDEEIDKKLTEEEERERWNIEAKKEMMRDAEIYGRKKYSEGSKYPPEFNKSHQLSICKMYAFHCVICERKFPTHGYKHREDEKDYLLVHHIDGNPQNGDFKNQVPLCFTCHKDIWKSLDLSKEYILNRPLVKIVHSKIYNLLDVELRKRKKKKYIR